MPTSPPLTSTDHLKSMTHSDTMALAFVVATCETEIDLDDAKSALVERLLRRGWL